MPRAALPARLIRQHTAAALLIARALSAFHASLVSPRTQVSFNLAWADAVLLTGISLRMRKPAGLCVMQTAATNSAELLSPASKHLSRLAEHELVDMGQVARDLKEQQRGSRGPAKTKRVSTCKGVCAYAGCKIKKPKRPQLRCGACGGGGGAFYHLPCFFAVHRCCIA